MSQGNPAKGGIGNVLPFSIYPQPPPAPGSDARARHRRKGCPAHGSSIVAASPTVSRLREDNPPQAGSLRVAQP